MVLKKGQVSTEYLMLVSFVVFSVVSFLGVALLYSGGIKDTIKFNQIDTFSKKVISLSESVFYSGYPSTTTVSVYLPNGVQSVDISGNYLIFNVTTSNGPSVIAYKSNVVLNGSISSGGGAKKIKITAFEDYVELSAGS